MRRRLTFTGFVVAFAIMASACGGGTGDQAAVSIKTLQAAVSNTQAADTTQFTMDMAVDVAGEQVSITAEGVTSADGQQAQLAFTIPMLGTVEQRIVDGTLYMNLGDLTLLGSLLPEGKQWVSVTPEELEARTGTDLGGLADQAQSNGPQQGLEYLQGLSGDVEKVGDDTVAGQHATQYRASIDYAKVAEKLQSSDPEAADKLAKLGTVPADVWIDDQDRVVKMHFAIDADSAGAGSGKAEITMEITGFGVPLDVQAPPPELTVDLLSLEGQTI